MKIQTTISLLAAVSLVVGCSYTRPIGRVGCGTNQVRFHKVQLGSLTAPGQTVLVLERADGGIEMCTPLGGNGWVPGIPQAAGLAAIGAGIGRARGDRTYVSQGQSANQEQEASNDVDVNQEQDFIGPRVPPGWLKHGKDWRR